MSKFLPKLLKGPWTKQYPKWKRPFAYLRLMKNRITYYDHIGFRLTKNRRILGYRFPVIANIDGDYTRLCKMKDIHKNKRCFVICTGPSLNKLDLTKLKNEITFGMNALYLNYDKMGFEPTYYVIEDLRCIEDYYKKINKFKNSIKFIPLRSSYTIHKDKNTIYFNFENPGDIDPQLFPAFSIYAPSVVFSGLTVTYAILQIAFHFGCNPVYLIGLDFNYKIPKDVRYLSENTMIFQSADPNHFHLSYHNKQTRFGKPFLNKNLEAYKLAKEVYEKHNRKIYNATAGGKLEIFERVAYNSLFNNPAP